MSRWKLAKFNSSPTFLVDGGGRRGDCTATCVTVYMDSVCGKLALSDIYYVMTTTYFYFVCIFPMNIITVQVCVRVAVGRHCSEGRRREKKDQRPSSNFGPIPPTQSFSHMSCRSWAQSFVSYHLMYWSRMCCNLRSLRTHMSGLEHHY